MRSLRWLAVVVLAMGATAALAQSGEPVCSLGGGYGVNFGAGYGKSGPYTITAKSSFEQKLPDGSYVRGYVRVKAARDNEKRTMTQTAQGCYRDEDGQLKLKYMVTVFDPTTKSGLTWTVGPDAEKIANVTRSSDFVPKPPRQYTEAEKVEQQNRAKLLQSETKTEDLGSRTIAGIQAQGSRTTRTIPVVEEGNELPLVTTQEFWRSKESGLMVMTISDDPRRGRNTYEVEDVTPGEPDASLFVPPADYKVEYRKIVVEEQKPGDTSVAKP